jgi:hypothetical protein
MASVDPRRLRLVDQLHGPLAHLLPREEVVIGAGNNVDNRVADAEDVEFALRPCERTPNQRRAL